MSATGMPHQVFISYASQDHDTADRVCRTLENTGLTCWMAPRDIPPGTDYPAAIVDGIRNATVLVLLLTDSAVKSPHILSEVGHAFNGRKRIVPFRLSKVALSPDLEYFLSMTQWLDAEDGATGANLKRLITAVRAAVRGEVPSADRKQRYNRRWLVVGGIALLVAAAAGIMYITNNRPLKSGPVVESLPPQTPPAKEPDHAAKTAAPASWLDPVDGQTYVWIPAGKFVMGCSPGDDRCGPDEKPAHPVTIPKGFWMGRTEVTNAAWKKYDPHARGEDLVPATAIAWADATKFCAWAGGRLPTEAEWEYAARGGTAELYYGNPSEIAWYADNSDDKLQPVQKKAPNAFGLFDMLGNAAEWVLDRYYSKYYLDSPATGPNIDQPLAPNASGTVRGGYFGGDVGAVRVSRRVGVPPDEPTPAIGFRCVAEHPAP